MLSDFNVYSKETSSEDIEILKLTGIFGVHPLDDFSSYTFEYKISYFKAGVEVTSSEKNIDVFEIQVISNHIKQCKRTIDVEDNFIENRALMSKYKSKGIASKILRSQVYYASKANFDFLTTLAARNDADDETVWIGYYIWGKLGFVMDTPSEVEDFRKLVSKSGEKIVSIRGIENLYDLIQVQEGKQLWIQQGSSWKGRFDLEYNSICRKNLRAVN